MSETTQPGPSRLLISRIRRHRWAIVAGGLLALLGGASTLAQPLVAKLAFDALARSDSAVGPMLLLAVLVVAGAGVSAISRYVLEWVAERVVLTERARLAERLLRLRMAAFDLLEPGDLMSRLTSDVTLLRSSCTHTVVGGVTGLAMTVGTLTIMATIDPVLMSAASAALLLGAGVAVLIMPRIRSANRRTQIALGGMVAVLERALSAMRTVRANGAERRETLAACTAAGEAFHSGLRYARWQSVLSVITSAAGQFAFLVVLGIGALRVGAGALSISELVAFLLYVMMLSGPTGQMLQATAEWQAGLAAVVRISEIDQLPTEQHDMAIQADTPQASVSVALSGVTFCYRPGLPPALRDVTMAVPAGGVTAIVGPSGAGKSTVFALLERFYEVERGVVAVDGVDVADWPLAQLRSVIGYVEQDAPVMTGTLRENLCYAAPGISDAEIAALLDRSGLGRFVEEFPHGLDTPIGSHGATLSGGQRQRIAIARALLRRPRLLLLDEVTSHLDAANESALRCAVERIAQTTTVVVIAHRLSTVRNANRIVVVESGRIRAVGTHDELLYSDELYRDLAGTQFLAVGS